MNTRYLLPASIAALLFASVSNSYADDFSQAAAKIDKIKPNIPYSTFCSATPKGEDKMACQIASIPTIALLVCQNTDYDGKSCNTLINEEVSNLTKVKQSGLATVDFRPSLLTPLNCATEKAKTCTGYLASWVSQGKFVNLDDAIEAGTIAQVADEIKSNTSAKGLAATRSDLKKIASFMTPGADKYSRICDLQGFYLRSGGFLINDVPTLYVKTTPAPACWDGMPDWQKSLDGINQLVKLLNEK
ncbi:MULTISPECIES: hypothetical protein [Enterobacteriaceae]|uniref:Uncharacterized protein n=1 Tax=Raoultella lignicola TaxID=3040939 RepID=A0ABU9F5E3_9ENTR|nr:MULTISPECIES: hypothetical protein [Enterobacteriaceae]MRT50775.1 hypothetical protein [Raoultella sp. RIT712]QNK08539.1 hypothetical protein HF679_03540 [Enterobacter sp. JUb54]ROS16243.1 hypothetical protein EDF82_1370 [Raoultella sp. BIGb0399]